MRKDPIRRQVLRVKQSLSGSQAEDSLKQGDMVLAINRKPVTGFRDIEDACQDIERHNCETGILKLTIFREVVCCITYLLFYLVICRFDILTNTIFYLSHIFMNLKLYIVYVFKFFNLFTSLREMKLR